MDPAGTHGSDMAAPEDAAFQRFAERCVFVDLEVGRDGELIAAGAVRGDRELALANVGRRPEAALRQLDEFARDAGFVVGHNLIGHDLPHLRAWRADLALLRLPAIDTLLLSPLAFPRKPYHALVKDYKLVHDARNDPVADARLTRVLFRDEWTAFAASNSASLAIFRACLAAWTAEPGARPTEWTDGTAAVFDALGVPPFDDERIVRVVLHSVAENACVSATAAGAQRLLADATTRPALAYAVAWLGVAETRSVLPRWVRAEFPAVAEFLHAVRDVPCGDGACAWCAEVHDPATQLDRLFGWREFRGPAWGPADTPVQEVVVRAGIEGRGVLAILPTSFGKSLCYQLPALVRYRRRGSLTVVVSPLQALMKDQVDVLEERVRGRYGAAIHGMLTPPERADVLERVRDGDVAILYVAPEQLRNVSFRSAVRAREIGAWVFDEAHCLSKWGHDFRTDYHHAGRFIRDYSDAEGVEVAPIACFTATAKRDVRDEILAYFLDTVGAELEVVEVPPYRDNLAFSVRVVTEHEKTAALDEELRAHLGDGPGAAIVYFSTRRRTEEGAEWLASRGWAAEAFHARVDAPQKVDVQNRFKRGDLRVICATSAFGMGIDKPDVRLVLHADVPGSLESYIQEAGRAGRDGLPSSCVLLFCASDLDTQFGLLARSRVTRRDIGQILQAIRRSRRGDQETVVVTPGELLQDDRTDVSFDADDRDARTKVFTAVSWLERGEFVARDENHTRVFQGRPLVKNLDEATRRMEGLGLSQKKRERWLAILRALMNADERTGLDMDQLAAATGFTNDRDDGEGEDGAQRGPRRSAGLELLHTLRDMTRQGLIEEGLCLSAFVRVGIADDSRARLTEVAALDAAIVALLRESAPDAQPRGDRLALDLRLLSEGLRGRGFVSATETVRRLVSSLAEDGRGLGGGSGSLVLRHVGGDRFDAWLQRTWDAMETTARLRREIAEKALDAILARAERDGLGRGDVLVAFGMSELSAHVERFPPLTSQVKDLTAALERALLFLHEQRVLTLQQGLAVFRQAMGIRLLPEARGRGYTSADYKDLEFHYAERIFQVHAMGEYARVGAHEPRRADGMVHDYFTASRAEFATRWFEGREDEIARATSVESYRRIVDSLGSRAQTRIVTATARRNLLVLAGPGSGKTRVVVHRCAYLLLVERVPPSSILVLCFNRGAAHELRARLRALVGDTARGVQVHTYHALALRLTGRSLAARLAEPGAPDEEFDFDRILDDANRLLRGEAQVAGIEPDALRDRLLAGYEHVLVDEYQDIDARQYDLIAAIAGRKGGAGERPEPATLLAVGDDDQNIYGWRGASVEYLRRFREDYDARVEHLVENFRSTANVIAAANAVIAGGRERMKASKPLRIDRKRTREARGGRLGRLDRIAHGRVQVLDVRDRASQVASVFAEMHRLRSVLSDSAYSDVAVLARTHAELEPFRAWCEREKIPFRRHVGGDAMPPLRHVREVARALDRLASAGTDALAADALRAAMDLPSSAAPNDPWTGLLLATLGEWRAEVGAAEVPVPEFVEYLHESLHERKHGHVVGEGVFLGTVHAAKGLEFRHVFVLDGGWDTTRPRENDRRAPEEIAEEERRVYYVAMTRARKSLCLLRRADQRNPFVREVARREAPWLAVRRASGHDPVAPEVLDRRFVLLGLKDVDLGFAGRHADDAAVHANVAGLRLGQPLSLHADGDRLRLHDAAGRVVGALSTAAQREWGPRLAEVRSASLFAVVRRDRSLTADAFRDVVRCDTWEVPLVELVVSSRARR